MCNEEIKKIEGNAYAKSKSYDWNSIENKYIYMR